MILYHTKANENDTFSSENDVPHLQIQDFYLKVSDN